MARFRPVTHGVWSVTAMKWFSLLSLTACAGASAFPKLDASSSPDRDAAAEFRDAAIGAMPDAMPDAAGSASPYRHTITIDGFDDFVAAEQFTTTSSPTYSAKLSWDDDHLYLGYHGDDFVTGSATKWVFAYLDVDPGAATGAAASQTYNTQSATLPVGFGAEYYLRHKTDNTLTSLQMWNGTVWVATAVTPVGLQSNGYFEMSIPRAALGSPARLGLTTWMINEGNNVESTYAGLYTGNFTDGYAANLTTYASIDFASARPPNDVANRIP